MKKIVLTLTLCCIYSWTVGVSSSFSFNLNKKFIVKPELNHSKYVYNAREEISTTVQSYHEAPMTSIRLTTESSIDICSASSLDESALSRKKRFTDYLQISTTTESSYNVDESILSDEFINCTHTTVEPECYVLYPNGSVYVPLYNMFFDRSNYVIDDEELLFVCPSFFDQTPGFSEKFSSGIGIVTIVCVAISTVFIIFHITMFLLVEKLRNLPGYCLFSLCISLLIAYMNFFVQIELGDHTDCKVIGILLMYSFLSSFFWMNVISFDVWHSIQLATSKLLLSTNRSMFLRFSLYSGYAWGVPFLILIIGLIVDATSEDIEYKLIFRTDTCWFRYKQALLVYFALPLFVVLTMNTFFFFSSFYMITRSRTASGSQEAYDLRSRLFLSLRLGTAMGLMWIFGVIDAATQQQWISYLQSVCNALQGVFIFFSFNFNKRTKNACKEVIRKKKSSILPTTSFLN